MQNPDGTAASTAQQQQRETSASIALLREAVLRLTQHAVRAAPSAAPTSRLTKLGPDDDVEAYLEVFERTAQRESWPEEQWAHIVAPFLTGHRRRARTCRRRPPDSTRTSNRRYWLITDTTSRRAHNASMTGGSMFGELYGRRSPNTAGW